jgi:1-acyl-sn-glycerol-3-phosphate acyltransferase
MIRNIFFWTIFAGTVIIGLLIAPIISIFGKREKVYHRITVIGAKMALWVGGVEVKLSGLENIPKDGGLIFVANHQSLTDGLVSLAIFPGYFRFVIMQQVYDVPILGSYFKRAGYVRVDQRDSRQAMLATSKIISLLRRGESIVIFPEGVRSPDENLQEFRSGAGMLILQADETVVPVAIVGSIKTMHKDEWSIHPGLVKVNIGKPMTFAEFKEVNLENAQVVTARLKETIERLMHESF